MRLLSQISKDQALDIARQECVRRGWPWTEPVSISGGLFNYRVTTNKHMRGGNVFIRVTARDGRVEYASYVNR